MAEKTYIRPGYRRTSAGHAPVDGVQFFSYRTGINQYARISEDGQIMTYRPSYTTTYSASVIGIGTLRNESGKYIRFRSESAAAKAAIKRWRALAARVAEAAKKRGKPRKAKK